MENEIITLIIILKKCGYIKYANKLEDAKKPSRVKIKIDPISLAVSLGLINSNILEALENEPIDNFQDLLDKLTKEDSEKN